MNSTTERIKRARKAAKLTQEELAIKVNTTKGTISNYENGHSTPSNQMLVELSEVLNVTTDYLLGKVDIEVTNAQLFNIGDKIKKLRVGRNITQKHLGEMFGLAESTIGMYERDERKPDYETLIRFANHFDVSVDCLLGNDRDNKRIQNQKICLGDESLLEKEYIFLKEVLKAYRDSNSEDEKN